MYQVSIMKKTEHSGHIRALQALGKVCRRNDATTSDRRNHRLFARLNGQAGLFHRHSGGEFVRLRERLGLAGSRVTPRPYQKGHPSSFLWPNALPMEEKLEKTIRLPNPFRSTAV